MQQYSQALKYILENGHDHPDRTGVGRRSVFGLEMRFDLNEGLPLVTTKKVFTRGIILELLWFLAGNADADVLSDQGVKIWDNWKVTEKDIDKYCNSMIDGEGELSQTDAAMLKRIKDQLTEQFGGSIGPLYGPAWRNAPLRETPTDEMPDVTDDMIASDKMELYKKLYEQYKEQYGEEESIDFEQFKKVQFYHSVDQMQNIVHGLKTNPYSARHVVSAWIPEWVPFENVSPQRNVMLTRGALAPCHVLQQYFVSPPKEEGGKMRLSLKMTQR